MHSSSTDAFPSVHCHVEKEVPSVVIAVDSLVLCPRASRYADVSVCCETNDRLYSANMILGRMVRLVECYENSVALLGDATYTCDLFGFRVIAVVPQLFRFAARTKI
jgi:hypothetical protein